MNRRLWLKNSAALTVGATALPSLLQKAYADPVARQELYLDLSHEFRAALAADALPPAAVKARLGANENPWGLSAKTKQAVGDSLLEANRYAMRATMDLYKAISEKDGVPMPQAAAGGWGGPSKSFIKLGCGSTELLNASLMHFATKGTIMVGDPCYISGNDEKFPIDKVKLTADYQYDLDAMAAKADPAKHSLIYICNPNNPTGNMLPPDKLRKFIDEVSPKVPVLVDEAYIDYATDPKTDCMVDKVKEGKNVIVLRTLSKLYAFAGMRLGYALGKPELLQDISKYTMNGFGLSLPTIRGAIAAFADADNQKMVLTKTAESKKYAMDFLTKAGYKVIPSYANFMLFPVNMKGSELNAKLMNEGVMVRNWFFDGQHWCRVSIGTMDEMKAFTEAFTKVAS
ncbi:pyridoxal phosphate-dependent aminotransferase [Siphonobacter aquaeclarae]|uniref:Histidinol-phosphate aminotransferase n=1 Tax=Siphonobacter aquaeclarae TaxID=563176 RepID=A0A1G9XQW0_9BACT|nr:histidinol-phosphate transaminase [Siphonobacter aquaeclarae]SDM98901.1 histidinol-phosphate aminotransferase [Siphonobacter aquaeclarae]